MIMEVAAVEQQQTHDHGQSWRTGEAGTAALDRIDQADRILGG
jgi:hypothetical protein